MLIFSFTVPSFMQGVRQDGVSTVVHVTNSVLQKSKSFRVRLALARQRQTPTSWKSSRSVKIRLLPDC